MKKIFTSNVVGFDENGTAVEIWEVESEEEQEKLLNIQYMDDAFERQEIFEDMFYHSDRGNVMPGARYETYSYHFNGGQVIITCHVSYNV